MCVCKPMGQKVYACTSVYYSTVFSIIIHTNSYAFDEFFSVLVYIITIHIHQTQRQSISASKILRSMPKNTPRVCTLVL